jgi:hypothetical protein
MEGVMMKRLLKGLWAASLAAVLTAFSTPAEAAAIACKVPFSFTVNGKALPPGTYRVSITQNVVLVQDFRNGAMVLTMGLESQKDTQPKLVFYNYGDEYILGEAWVGEGEGRQLLPKEPLERRLAEAARSGEVVSRITIPAL